MLADDHHIFRQMIVKHLMEFPDKVTVIGDATNGQALLDLMVNVVPDIILLDLEMPVLDGHKTLEIITSTYPTVKTIILSTYYNQLYLAQTILLGARGYLSKDCFDVDLIPTIEKVNTEGYYFDNRVSRAVISGMIDSNKYNDLRKGQILTEREIEILKMICNEFLYKQIADRLDITLDTVKFHVKNIYKKTQHKSTAGLVKFAIKTGISPLA